MIQFCCIFCNVCLMEVFIINIGVSLVIFSKFFIFLEILVIIRFLLFFVDWACIVRRKLSFMLFMYFMVVRFIIKEVYFLCSLCFIVLMILWLVCLFSKFLIWSICMLFFLVREQFKFMGVVIFFMVQLFQCLYLWQQFGGRYYCIVCRG